MKKYSVFAIGNPLIDLICRITDSDIKALNLAKGTMHLIDEAQRIQILTYIKDKKIQTACGGSAPNTVITVSALGKKAVLAGKVGADDYGKKYRRQAKKSGIKDELKASGNPTGSSIILVSEDSERTMNTYLGANREYSEEDINFKLLEQSSILYFTGYMWDTDNQKNALLKAVAFAKKHGITVAFDAADPFAVERSRSDFLGIIENHADIVFANEEEAAMLCGGGTAASNIEKLAGEKRTAVIKCGKNGALLKNGTKPSIKIPVFEAVRRDTTGAGDIFAAGFLYGLASGWELEKCGLAGSLLASKIIERPGAQFTSKEIKNIKKELKKL